MLNGLNSSLVGVKAGTPQGSILGALPPLLIYINDLSNNVSANEKLFADDTSLFSVVHDITTSFSHLINNLDKAKPWAFQWKLNYNSDPSETIQQVIFTRKFQKLNWPP